MKALAGIVLAVAAVAGGKFIGTSLDNAISAPLHRFDAAADARLEQAKRERAEKSAREQAELHWRVMQIRAAIRCELTRADYDGLKIGMPAIEVHAALAPFKGQEFSRAGDTVVLIFQDGPRSITAVFSGGVLAAKSQWGL